MEVEIEPTYHEMLAIVAILWAELDNCRSNLGANAQIFTTQRTFSNEDLVRGGKFTPKAYMKRGGSIVVRMEP